MRTQLFSKDMLQVPAAQRGTGFRDVSEDEASLGIVLGKSRVTSGAGTPWERWSLSVPYLVAC